MMKPSSERGFRLERYPGNPILSPLEGSAWQCEVTTNPGAWRDEASGEVFLLYRAAGSDAGHRVHFGLAFLSAIS